MRGFTVYSKRNGAGSHMKQIKNEHGVVLRDRDMIIGRDRHAVGSDARDIRARENTNGVER